MKFIRTCQIAVVVLFILLYSSPSPGFAASNEPMRVYVNGDQVLFTQLPIVEEGNTLVQLRPIYESLGIEIDWDEETQTITSTEDQWKIVMVINSTEATINGKPVTLSIAPRIVNETTYIPLRFAGESVEGDVTWDEKTNHVDIINNRSYYVYLAALRNDLEKVKYWLGRNGGANFANKSDGLTTLSFALHNKNNEMIELLLKFGADPNHSLAGFGSSLRPLVSAVLDKDPTVVQLLIDYGADASLKDREGTALDLAQRDLQKETHAANKQKLEQIITILEKSMQKDTLTLSEDKVLVPFNGGADINYVKGETGSWGYFDNTGAVTIKPRFAMAYPFSEGLAFARTKDGNQSGYIDKTGKFRFTFDFYPTLVPGDFKEGLALVGKNRKWGFIDKTGAFVIDPIYNDALPFSDGLAAVKTRNKWGLINRTGEVVVEPKYEWIFPFHNGLALVRGDRSGFMNTKGELVIDFQALGISEYGQFSGNFAPVRKNEKVGYINTKGQFIIPPIYEKADEFGEGSAAVIIDGKYGYIDSSGQVIISPQFDFAVPFRNGQAFVKQNGKWGFINTKGVMIVPPIFTGFDNIMGNLFGDQYSPFSDRANGMALLLKGDQTYYLLPDGKIIEFVKQ